MTCLSCSAEVTNGLALCEMCRYAAGEWLTYLPVHFRNLARNRQPGRPNGSMGTSGQWLIRRGETDPSLIQQALGRVMNDLTTWARCLADDRSVELPDAASEAETVTALCSLFTDHLTSIATLEWAGQFVRDLRKHERALAALTETAVPGWYAGACRQVTGRDMEGNVYTCGTDTYVIPGLRWLTCSGCGATTAARDHLPLVLEEAREWVARPKALAGALVALLDTEQSIERLYDRIRKWRSLGWLEGTRKLDEDGDPVGPYWYQLGDVLDLVLGNTDAPTRAMRMTTA